MDASNIFNPYQGLSQDELNTQFLEAVARGDDAVIQPLLEAGANINTTNNLGQTALMWAAYRGDTATVEILIERGANINTTAHNGETALMFAAQKGHTAVAFRLLSIMTPEEIDVFISIKDKYNHINLVHQFDRELKDNTNKLYNILMPTLKVFPGSPFLLLPSELVNHILTLELEVLVQDFPEWYRHRIKSDLDLTIKFVQDNKKVPALIFSSDAPGSHKTKTEDTLEESMTKKLNLSDDDENSATKSGCFLPFRM